jgi:hypothetical protein
MLCLCGGAKTRRVYLWIGHIHYGRKLDVWVVFAPVMKESTRKRTTTALEKVLCRQKELWNERIQESLRLSMT